MTSMITPATLAAEIAKRDADAQAAYLAAIREGATEPKTLLALADAAGVAPNQVQDDLRVVQELTMARRAVVDIAPLHAATTAAGEAASAYSDETRRIVDEREAEQKRLDGEERSADLRETRALAAKDRLKQLEQKHWRLAGREDPAAAPGWAHAVAVAQAQAQAPPTTAMLSNEYNQKRAWAIQKAEEDLAYFHKCNHYGRPREAYAAELAGMEAKLAAAKAVPVDHP